MATKHEIVILRDTKFGAEPGLFVDGKGVGFSEGMIQNDLRAIQPHIQRGFTLQEGDGYALSIGNWPDRLDQVEGLVLHNRKR